MSYGPLSYLARESEGEHGMALIAKVASHADPHRHYNVERVGKKLAQGGKGVHWKCPCPHWSGVANGKRFRKEGAAGPCSHMKETWKHIQGEKQSHVFLSAAGKRFKETGGVGKGSHYSPKYGR